MDHYGQGQGGRRQNNRKGSGHKLQVLRRFGDARTRAAAEMVKPHPHGLQEGPCGGDVRRPWHALVTGLGLRYRARERAYEWSGIRQVFDQCGGTTERRRPSRRRRQPSTLDRRTSGLFERCCSAGLLSASATDHWRLAARHGFSRFWHIYSCIARRRSRASTLLSCCGPIRPRLRPERT